MSNPWEIDAADVTSADWPDIAALDPVQAQERLDAAVAACEAYAPVLDPTGLTFPDELPPGWRLAAIYQARDIHNASKRTGDAVAITDVYAVRLQPLSATVKALLRPQTPRYVTG